MKRKMKKTRKSMPSPFQVPTDAQLCGYVQWQKARRRRQQHRSIPIKEFHHVEPKNSVFTDLGQPTITDIDPGFFTDVAGRPIREKLSKHRYIDHIRRILKTRLLMGYDRDDCMRIDQQFAEEEQRFTAIERRYRRYVGAFEDYLSIDHESSMKVLDEAQQEARNTHDLIIKRDRLLKEFGQVRLEVYQWDEMWRVAKMCHEFVQKITPIQHLDTEQNEKQEEKSEAAVNSEREFNLGSLEDIVGAFERDIRDGCLGSTEISMKDPLELSRIFGTIELRNLDALIHLESLAGPMDEMTSSVARVQELIESEVGSIEESLEELRSLILLREERASKLEAYADYLLHDVFRELVCSESVLHLRVFIEDTYEGCVGPNDASLDGYSMMRAIEKTYESLNMSLDNLPHNIVKSCEKEGFSQEMRTFREAEDAAKKFDLMHRLLAALERIMKPTDSNMRPKSTPSLAITPNFRITSSMYVSEAPKQRTRREKPQKTIMKQPRRFFSDDCDSKEIDIQIDIDYFDGSKKQNGGEHRSDASVDNGGVDCRDSVS